MPNSDSEEPKRAKLRTDIEDPKCRKSSTDNADPIRSMLRSDIDEPK
jgi:hypothetical protein